MRKLISGLYYNVIKALIFSKILDDIRFHKVFDEQLYLEQNPEIDSREIDPLLHFLLYGRLEKRDAGIWFDLCYYLERTGPPRTGFQAILPWIINPDRLLYRRTEAESDLILSQQDYLSGSIAARVMEPSTLSIQYQSAELNPAYEKDLLTYQSFRPVKLIALYYTWEPVNTAKENRVLTEIADWRTVAGSLPLFPGHFQPKLPGELGYYDARVPAILQRQVELATGAGIHGFCFDIPTASAFNSKKDLEIRFCLRDFSNPVYPDSPVNISSDQLIAIFSDERYIRIEKKPLILVKNQYVCKQWRKLAAKIRPDGFFIVMTTENLESVHLQHAGCDGILDLPPFNFNSLPATTESGKIYPGFRGKHFIYSDIINQSLTLETLDITCFRGVFPAWDNTALKRTPDIVLGSSPELFQEWLSSMMDWTLRNNPPDKQLLFINAWNDWSNGCYLEPDRAYGYGYLNATVRAFHSIKNSAVYEK